MKKNGAKMCYSSLGCNARAMSGVRAVGGGERGGEAVQVHLRL